MSSLSLSFNNVDLTPINNNDGQIWLTSAQLASALGYKSSRSITNLYNTNSDEFTDSMSLVIDSVTKGFGNGNSVKPVRIFSLRGCHLVAMFARTKVAKDFRKWVLDVLDNYIANEPTYKLGDLQKLRDRNRAQYSVGFTVAGQGGKVLNNWKHEKYALDAELQVIDNLMQPLLTGLEMA